MCLLRLRGSTADEEPLVYRAVDLGRGNLLVGGNRRQLVVFDAARGAADSHVGGRDITGLGLASEKSVPGLSALMNDIHGVAVFC